MEFEFLGYEVLENGFTHARARVNGRLMQCQMLLSEDLLGDSTNVIDTIVKKVTRDEAETLLQTDKQVDA